MSAGYAVDNWDRLMFWMRRDHEIFVANDFTPLKAHR